MKLYLPQCTCGSGREAEAQFDGYGIFLCYACSKCLDQRMSGFRPDIHERYDADEPIEPED